MAGFIEALTRKQRKPKGFNYIPRYYNPEKEEFNAMVERFRAERDAIERGETPRVNFKGAFTSQVGSKKNNYQKMIALYNMRLLIILIAVTIGAYYLFQTGKIASILNQFLTTFSKKDGLY